MATKKLFDKAAVFVNKANEKSYNDNVKLGTCVLA
jgi:hypothetical protein